MAQTQFGEQFQKESFSLGPAGAMIQVKCYDQALAKFGPKRG
jgi:hypothetical protein